MTEALPPAVSLRGHVPDQASGQDLRARIDDLHARGAAGLDPVGWRVIEAMLRRLDAFDGAAGSAIERAKLSPSIGICATPPMTGGAPIPTSSSKVGTRSLA